MNRDNIICMAQEAGIAKFVGTDMVQFTPSIFGLEHFAALVAAAEREACAKACEDIAEQVTYQRNSQEAADRCADAIRARGTP